MRVPLRHQLPFVGLLAVAGVSVALVAWRSPDPLLILALVSLALAVIGSVLWSRRLARALDRLAQASRAGAEGRSDFEVAGVTRGEIGGWVAALDAMAIELSARTEAQARLIQSERMAAFGQLGAGVAHEINNPLCGLLGMIQLLERQPGRDPEMRNSLAIMEAEAKRCGSIVENLLKFARQEKVAHERVDLGVVVADSASIMSGQLALDHIELETSVEERLPRVIGNGIQLQQVLMNLILNAQQAMGGKPGRVVVEAKRTTGGGVELKVIDDGPGIPKEIQRRIFEPFFTTKPTGQGTGLGLSVSYGIVLEHQGAIEVVSEAGAGTTIVIRLPGANSAQSAPAAAAA